MAGYEGSESKRRDFVFPRLVNLLKLNLALDQVMAKPGAALDQVMAKPDFPRQREGGVSPLYKRILAKVSSSSTVIVD